MKIFRRLKNWLFPPKLANIEPLQLIDLVDATVRAIISNDIQTKIDDTEQYILIWVDIEEFINIPVDFEIIKLKEYCHSAQAFVIYIQNKLRKAGIKCQGD